MRFLVFDGELVNVGSIQEINFDAPPLADGDPADVIPTDGNPLSGPPPISGRVPARKPLAGSRHAPSATLPQDRARILVLGRSEPLETSDPQRIARLRELWRARRGVRA